MTIHLLSSENATKAVLHRGRLETSKHQFNLNLLNIQFKREQMINNRIKQSFIDNMNQKHKDWWKSDDHSRSSMKKEIDEIFEKHKSKNKKLMEEHKNLMSLLHPELPESKSAPALKLLGKELENSNLIAKPKRPLSEIKELNENKEAKKEQNKGPIKAITNETIKENADKHEILEKPKLELNREISKIKLDKLSGLTELSKFKPTNKPSMDTSKTISEILNEENQKFNANSLTIDDIEIKSIASNDQNSEIETKERQIYKFLPFRISCPPKHINLKAQLDLRNRVFKAREEEDKHFYETTDRYFKVTPFFIETRRITQEIEADKEKMRKSIEKNAKIAKKRDRRFDYLLNSLNSVQLRLNLNKKKKT